MARYLGETVHYTPHRDFTHLGPQKEFAAIVGAVHPDGSADLFVLVPNRAPFWADRVPVGDAHHSHRSIAHAGAVAAPLPADAGA